MLLVVPKHEAPFLKVVLAISVAKPNVLHPDNLPRAFLENQHLDGPFF